MPYWPLTFNFFPQKRPFLREPAIFRDGDPALSFDSPPPETPRPVTLSWRPWPWFRRKTPKHGWVESFQKSKTFKLFIFSKRYISAENDSWRLNLGSKRANKSTLVQHKTPWQYWCSDVSVQLVAHATHCAWEYWKFWFCLARGIKVESFCKRVSSFISRD